MKKTVFSILSILFILCMASSCNKTASDADITTATVTNINQTENAGAEATTQNVPEDAVPQALHMDTAVASPSDEGGGVIGIKKYRMDFYDVTWPFVKLVGKETYRSWLTTIESADDSEQMIMPQFIQHFGITREQFDKANLEMAKIIQNDLDGRPCLSPKDYANQDTDEIYNGDIIFTFDDETIRRYYLSPDYPFLYDYEFDEAVAAGEYTPQTEEWIDIDQMEADILAKYGSLD